MFGKIKMKNDPQDARVPTIVWSYIKPCHCTCGITKSSLHGRPWQDWRDTVIWWYGREVRSFLEHQKFSIASVNIVPIYRIMMQKSCWVLWLLHRNIACSKWDHYTLGMLDSCVQVIMTWSLKFMSPNSTLTLLFPSSICQLYIFVELLAPMPRGHKVFSWYELVCPIEASLMKVHSFSIFYILIIYLH